MDRLVTRACLLRIRLQWFVTALSEALHYIAVRITLSGPLYVFQPHRLRRLCSNNLERCTGGLVQAEKALDRRAGCGTAIAFSSGVASGHSNRNRVAD
jgi:hypothetical protein